MQAGTTGIGGANLSLYYMLNGPHGYYRAATPIATTTSSSNPPQGYWKFKAVDTNRPANFAGFDVLQSPPPASFANKSVTCDPLATCIQPNETYWIGRYSSSSTVFNEVSGSSDPGAAVTPTGDSPVSFTDVPPTDQFYLDISYLAARGIISGITNGDGSFRFEPLRPVTRAEFAKMIVLGFGIAPYTPSTPSFNDVPPDSLFYPYIEAAGHAGVVHGLTQAECGTQQLCFKPERSITRGEAASIIERAGAYPSYTPVTPDFSDVPTEYFAYTAIETLYHLGIVSGAPCKNASGICFSPEDAMHRNELSKVLHHALLHSHEQD